MLNNITGYDVGALMYCPANAHEKIAESLQDERFSKPFSLAFCLEDTVREDAVEEAEEKLFQTLDRIVNAKKQRDFYVPLIFIRIRSPKQLEKLVPRFSVFDDILTGYILPKFFIENCDEYISAIQAANASGHEYYYMPIFESASMIDLKSRHDNLTIVKERLNVVSDYILNIRVGGNDFSHAFGLRRRITDTIYDVRPVADLLIDIVTSFAPQYVVSGPVWEYFDGEGWDMGLRREVELDLLSGFIGKTVIHPKQIEIVNEALKVSADDYKDACSILNWDPSFNSLVSASAEATRMNEYNTHFNWANRVMKLANTFGVKSTS